jgi:uncharacterized protein (DUF983 family)
MLGRCPFCGQGRLYSGFIDVRPRCESCGEQLASAGSSEDPFAFIILVVGMIVVFAALIVEVRYAWPVWLHMVVWLPLAMILCLAMLRPVRGLLVAIQLRHRPDEVTGHN